MGFCRITYLSLKPQKFHMRKLFLSFLLISLFLVQGVFAQDFSISIDSKESYLASKVDYINVNIKNPMAEDWFTTSMFGVPQEWAIVEEPLLRIPTGGIGTVRIKVEPSRDALPGIYQYFLKVTRVSTKSEFETPFLLEVKQTTSAIVKDVSLSCTSCLEKLDVSGTVYNVGSKKIDVAVVVTAANIKKTINIGRIAVTDYRDFETSFDLNDILPGDYKVFVKVIDASGKVLYEDYHPFVIPSIEEIYYAQQVSPSPFGSIITLSAENRGNTIADVQLTSPNAEDWFYFISGPSPSGMFLEKYAWTSSIGPGEIFKVTYSEIYWPVYVFVVAVVFVASILYWQTSDIDFSKNAIALKRFKPGKEFSVSLHLKNKKEDLKRVTVRDLVPSGFSVVNKFEAAKPLIRKVGSGIELFWEVGRLDPHEERVFHYTIKPDAETVRKSNLPGALVKVMRKRKFFSKRSNGVSLVPEEIETRVVTVRVAK